MFLSSKPARTAAIVIAALTPALSAAADLIESTWAAGMDGSWNVNEFWAPWGIPHNAGPVEYHAFIHSGYEVTLDLSVDLTSLTVTPGSGLDIANSRHLRLFDGDVVNEGAIRLAATTSSTEIVFGGTGTVEVSSADGIGEIILDVGEAPGFSGMSGTGFAVLVNGEGHTIRGVGRLGQRTLNITNEGLITADVPGGRLELSPSSSTLGGVINTSVLRAENGGTLELQRNHHTNIAEFDNTGGVIEALDGSAVEIDGYTHIVGGELRTVGSGVIRCIWTNASFIDVTLNGEMRLGQDVDAVFAGSIVNAGLIAFDSTGPIATGVFKVTSLGDVVLSGGGTIDLGDGGAGWITAVSGFEPRLTNVDNLIRGAGRIGRNVLSVTNQGTLRAASDLSGVEIDPPSPGDFTNEGALEVLGAGGMTIKAGPFTTSGTVFIADGTTLTRFGAFPQTAGTTTVDGTLTVTSEAFELSGGALRGSGTIVGAVSVTGGSVEPGNSPGDLSITGTYDQGGAGTLTIEVGGTDPGVEHDRLSVGANVTLAGALHVSLVGGFEPATGDAVTIVESSGGSVGGVFDDVVLPEGATLYYSADAVIVEWNGVACPADFNGDGTVGFADLVALLSAWGTPEGDINGDGTTNFADVIALLAAWGVCA